MPVPRRGVAATEVSLVEGAQRVPVPFGGGNEYVCPQCEKSIPPLRTVFLSKPPKYSHVLNDVIKCANCKFIFSPRMEAYVLRQ